MIRVLKISLIDWCYRIRQRDRSGWRRFSQDLESALLATNTDVCVIERNSYDWHLDFLHHVPLNNYTSGFVDTALLDSRLNIRGGTTVLIHQRRQDISIQPSLTLPSARAQFDGGQPTSIPVIAVNGIRIAIGSMPQNLGRETPPAVLGTHDQLITTFWPGGAGQDILAVPVWDADADRYDVHVWQLKLSDALQDDQTVIDFLTESNTITMVEMFQEYHSQLNQDSLFPVKLRYYTPRVNPMRICSSIAELEVTQVDVPTPIAGVNRTSLIGCFELNHLLF